MSSGVKSLVASGSVRMYMVVACDVFTTDSDAAKELSTAARSVMIPATILCEREMLYEKKINSKPF